MKEENNIKALDELNKGACMGMDAIKYIIDKAEDQKFKDFLEHQYFKYNDLSNKITKLYSKYNHGLPQETNAMTKAMTWYNIQLKTIKDSTSSKLAEMLFQGFNMGISEGIKLLNHKEVSKDVYELIEEYVKEQQASIERTKAFL